MSYRCPHGRIVETPDDCPECRSSLDTRDIAHYTAQGAEAMSRAASAAEAEARERARQRRSAEATEREMMDVGTQQRAVLAQQRYEMGDTAGAIQLITEAIERRGDFASFYIQRSRYYAAQGLVDLASQDLGTAFTLNPEVLLDVERRLEAGELQEYAVMQADLAAAISSAREMVATDCRATLSEARELLSEAKSGAAGIYCKQGLERLESVPNEIVSLLESGSTPDLLLAATLSKGLREDVPLLVQEAKNAADDARRSRDESERLPLETKRSSVLGDLRRLESKIKAETDAIAERYRERLDRLDRQEQMCTNLSAKLSRVGLPPPIAYVLTGVLAFIGLWFGLGSIVFYALVTPFAVLAAIWLVPRIRRKSALNRRMAIKRESDALRQAKKEETERRRAELVESLGLEGVLRATSELDKRIVELGGASSGVRHEDGRPN